MVALSGSAKKSVGLELLTEGFGFRGLKRLVDASLDIVSFFVIFKRCNDVSRASVSLSGSVKEIQLVLGFRPRGFEFLRK